MPAGASHFRRSATAVAGALGGLARLDPATAGAVVVNTVRMSVDRRRERRLAHRPAVARTPGRLESIEPLTERRVGANGRIGRPVVVGASCRFAEADLEIRFLADDLVRVSWGPGEPPVPWALSAAEGGALGAAPAAGDAPPRALPGRLGPARGVRVAGDAAGGCTVAARSLSVHVAPDGALRYRSGAAVVRHELAPVRRGDGRIHRHLLRPDERVTGLGEQSGQVDLRGGARRLWNRDPGGGWGPGSGPLYCVVPVMVGVCPGRPDDCVLAFYDNPYDGTVRVDAPPAVGAPRVEVAFTGGMLRHYVAVGPLPAVLERYTGLTGRPPLPPRWALGYHQSRWGYRSDADVRAVADGFAAERLPLSVVHLDIDYMDGYRVFTVDRGRFPDLGGLAGHLATRGTRVVAIIDPAVKADPHDEVYAEGVAEGRFVLGTDGAPLTGVVWPGTAVFPDFTDPVTRRWWGAHYGRLLDDGVAGVWHDMNEPTSMALWGDRTLPPTARHVAEGAGGEHRQCHNVYGLCMDAAGACALRAARPGRRPFVLSRAGWAGLQRWAWNWTGDTDSTWEALRQQVATVVGLGLSGVAFAGADVGGFAGAPSPELYLRWLELSVFLPLCRTHCVAGVPGREPWRFPEPYRSAIGRLVRFRYRLLPYLYTLAHEAAVDGHPLVRPSWWPVAGAAGTQGSAGAQGGAGERWSDDCFLLGDAVLVAPVVETGARARGVTLPPGTWLHWRPLAGGAPGAGEPAGTVEPVPVEAGTAEAVSVPAGTVEAVSVPAGTVEPVTAGGAARSTVELDAPLGCAPVLVRAGTVLPLDDGWGPVRPEGDDGLLVDGHGPRAVAFHCFPDGSGAAGGGCYDDEGDGYGPSRIDRLDLVPGRDGARTLRWSSEGSWPRPGRVRIVVHGMAAASAVADGTPVAVVVSGDGAGLATTTVECGPFDVLELG